MRRTSAQAACWPETLGSQQVDSRGFTLIEIVITLGILGLIAGMVYGVFARVLASKQLVERRAEDSAFARTALERITRDLEATIVSLGAAGIAALPMAQPRERSFGAMLSANAGAPGISESNPTIFFESADRAELGIAQDEIAFSALVWQPTSSGSIGRDLATIRYYVLSDRGAQQRNALYREMTPSLSSDEGDDAADQSNLANASLILENVASLHFRFYDGEEWVEEWDSKDARSFTAVPRAVEVALTILDADGEPETFRTAVELPAAKLVLARPGTSPTPGAGTAAQRRRRIGVEEDDEE